MKERVITLLTALTALLLVNFLLSPQRSNAPKPASLPTTEDHGSEGLKGLFSWLQREQRAAVSLRKRFTALEQDKSIPPRGNVLILSLPAPEKIIVSEWSALSRWLARGNNLVILGAVYQRPAWAKGDDCFCEVKKLLDSEEWTLYAEETEKARDEPGLGKAKSFQDSIAALKANVNNHLPQANRLSAVSSLPLLQGVKTLDTQTTPNLLQKRWALHSENIDKLALRLFELTTPPVTAAWQIKAGKGRIMLLLTPDIFSNSRLNHADNARFFSNLLGFALAPEGRVLFDDYHFGLSELYDAEHFFKDERLHQTLAWLGLLWLFYVIGYTTRLAPVRVVERKLSTREFIDATAGFFARRLNRRLVAEALVKHLLTDLGKHRRLHDEAGVWHWLEQHNQIADEQLGLLKRALAKQRLSLKRLTNTITDIRTVTL